MPILDRNPKSFKKIKSGENGENVDIPDWMQGLGDETTYREATYDFGHGAATTMAFCLDPEGNRIELIQHHDRRAREDHAAFLGLSALGWPART